MGRVLMNAPPPCPDGEWCPACLMIAKQQNIPAGLISAPGPLKRRPR